MNIKEIIQSNPLFLRTVRFTASIFILIGFVGFLGGAAIAIGFINPNFELPLGHVTSIAVDRYDNIYLGLEFYGYIQKYNNEGEFIKNWRAVGTSGGAFNMLCQNEKIITSSARGDLITEYDLNGKLINTSKDANAYQWGNKNSEIEDNQGNIYRLDGWILSKITKTKKGGGRGNTIISMDLLRSIFKGPEPAWLIAFLGILLYRLSVSTTEKSKLEEKIEATFRKLGFIDRK
ncbi:MAG: hypothetical protein ACRBG0_21470 [Lewinella sp.]|uniref:hypothetical protein n=1 Tax=Lewinella sp. TaxID=2004506 RepID=UPI003D6B1F07